MAALNALKVTNSSPTPMDVAEARAIATADKPGGGDGGDSDKSDGDDDGGGQCKFDGKFLGPAEFFLAFWPLIGILASRWHFAPRWRIGIVSLCSLVKLVPYNWCHIHVAEISFVARIEIWEAKEDQSPPRSYQFSICATKEISAPTGTGSPQYIGYSGRRGLTGSAI